MKETKLVLLVRLLCRRFEFHRVASRIVLPSCVCASTLVRSSLYVSIAWFSFSYSEMFIFICCVYRNSNQKFNWKSFHAVHCIVWRKDILWFAIIQVPKQKWIVANQYDRLRDGRIRREKKQLLHHIESHWDTIGRDDDDYWILILITNKRSSSVENETKTNLESAKVNSKIYSMHRKLWKLLRPTISPLKL